MEKVKVVMYGLGYIGNGLVELMVDKEWIEIVGAIDSAKDKVGKDLGEVTGIGKKLGVIVSDDADAVLSSSKANLVAHSTPFFPDQTDVQIMQCIASLHFLKLFSILAFLFLNYFKYLRIT